LLQLVNRPLSVRQSILLCAILCVLYAILAGSAVLQKSATFDEPRHLAVGWLDLWQANYQLSPEQLPLWEYWMALPLGRDSMSLGTEPFNKPLDQRVMGSIYQPPAKGVDLLNRARMMCLPLAVLLAILIALWAGEVAGPAAAVAAMFVFVFDPNWLGHGPLAKNDVAFSLAFFAAFYATWRLGKRFSIPAVVAVILVSALGLGVKLSGLIIAPLVVVCLLARAEMRELWITANRRRRLAAVAGIGLGIVIASYALLWTEYRFRFEAGIDMNASIDVLRWQDVSAAANTDAPTRSALAAWRADTATSAVLWLQSHRLVPQAWAAGYVALRSVDSGNWRAYLLGNVYSGGVWYYFPLALLFKEPLALIGTAIGAAWIGLRSRPIWSWTLLAALIPALVYSALMIGSNLNIGLRHLFPIIPFIDVGIGVAAARVWTGGGRAARFVVVILAVGLAAETLSAYPDFISFFNLACGGERGGISLLSDSNLDWGQDLPLLADWQKQNPTVPLYLDYFGYCDPAVYGIRYRDISNGNVSGLRLPGIAAISATNLQGTYASPQLVQFHRQFDRKHPLQVLGGTIYLFRYTPNDVKPSSGQPADGNLN
jgi:hypothetical protein